MSKGCTENSVGQTFGVRASKWYATTLISGIVGCLARNYIPVGCLSGSIQIKRTVSTFTQLGEFSTVLVFQTLNFMQI